MDPVRQAFEDELHKIAQVKKAQNSQVAKLLGWDQQRRGKIPINIHKLVKKSSLLDKFAAGIVGYMDPKPLPERQTKRDNSEPRVEDSRQYMQSGYAASEGLSGGYKTSGVDLLRLIKQANDHADKPKLDLKEKEIHSAANLLDLMGAVGAKPLEGEHVPAERMDVRHENEGPSLDPGHPLDAVQVLMREQKDRAKHASAKAESIGALEQLARHLHKHEDPYELGGLGILGAIGADRLQAHARAAAAGDASEHAIEDKQLGGESAHALADTVGLGVLAAPIAAKMHLERKEPVTIMQKLLRRAH